MNMDNTDNQIKKTVGWMKGLYILMSVLYILAGIFMFTDPFVGSYTLSLFIGWTMLFYGIMMVMSYFFATYFKSDAALLIGIVLIFLGIVVVMNPAEALKWIGVATGIAFMVVGTYKFIQSFSFKEIGMRTWWLILIDGILMAIVGCMLAFNPAESGYLFTVYVAISFIVNGVTDLLIGLMAL